MTWVGVVVVVAVLGGWAVSRLRLRRQVLALARAGAAAVATEVPDDQLSLRQQELLAQFERLGFDRERPVHVALPGRPGSVYANARDRAGTTWFRSSSVEGIDSSSSSLITHFPGGRFVTASDASSTVDPGEVLQCVPDPAPGYLLRVHQEALEALASHGARPIRLEGDARRRVEEEWHGEARLILGWSPLEQVRRSGEFFRPAVPTSLLTDRPDVAEVADRLGAPRR